MNADLVEDLDKLTDIIEDVIKANKYKVTDKHPAGDKGVHIDCKGFSLEAYNYAFLGAPTIWLFCKILKKDKYSNLVEQLKLLGFEVFISDVMMFEECGSPLITEIYLNMASKIDLVP